MGKFRSIKNSFLGGMISPTAQGRTDHPAYPHGCNLLRNVIPLLSGGVYRRPGTFFEFQVDASGAFPSESAGRIIPFVVSQTEAYALLFTRTSSATVVRAFRPTGNSVLSTQGTVSSDFALGQHPYHHAVVNASTSDNSSDPSSFNRDEIHDVQYVQSVDDLFMAHPLREPAIIYRTATDNFSGGTLDAVGGHADPSAAERDVYPYLAENTSATTLTASATSAAGSSITITASAAFFNALHVGALVKIFDGASTYGCAKITAYTDSTHVTARVLVAFGDTSAHTTWWEGAWSNYRGWPRSVGIYQQRLVFAGNKHQPDSIWFSTASNFFQFSQASIVDPNTSPTGTQPFTVTLSSQQLNLIQWINFDKQLVIGTSNDEWLLDREDQSRGFGCDNCNVVRQSAYGSDYMQAVKVGYELLFVLKSQDEIRSYQYNYVDSSFFADPIQLMFDQYPKGTTQGVNQGVRKYRAITWDESRKTLWCIDLAGNLFGMTRERKLQITTWHTHTLGGDDPTNVGGGAMGTGNFKSLDPAYDARAGAVISIAVVPNPKLGVSDLWMLVKRYVNGGWYFHLERMIGRNLAVDSAYSTSGLPSDPGVTGPYMTDASVYNSFIGGVGVPTDAFAGFGHLAAVTPVGTYYSPYGISTISGGACSGGNCTLNTPYPGGYTTQTGAVILGLPYTSVIEPLRLDAGSAIGTAAAAIKRINRAFVRFFKTLGAKVGSDPSGQDTNPLETLVFRQGNTPMGKSPELFTGDFEVQVTSTYDRDGYLYIMQDQPLPFCVVSIVFEGQEYDA